MNSSACLQLAGFRDLLEFVFTIGPTTVFQAYSRYGENIQCFGTSSGVIKNVEEESQLGEVFLSYVIHYPEMKGHIEKERIALDPKSCDGHTFRFCVMGWGLIQLQADLRTARLADCRVAVNSGARAKAWFSTYPQLQDPDLWDWTFVKKRAGQIARRMRRIQANSPSAPSDFGERN